MSGVEYRLFHTDEQLQNFPPAYKDLILTLVEQQEASMRENSRIRGVLADVEYAINTAKEGSFFQTIMRCRAILRNAL